MSSTSSMPTTASSSPSLLSQVTLSMLDLVPTRTGHSTADAIRESVAVAQHVEQLGFERFWLAELAIPSIL